MTQNDSNTPDAAPKIHIDSDWKAEAQREKERLAAAEATASAAPGGPGAADRMPEASFSTLVGMLTSQALMGLGTMMDRESRGVMIDLEGARFAIDLLQIIDDKSKGNLTKEESDEITQVIVELRSRYVQVTQLLAQQAAAGNVAPGGSPDVMLDPGPGVGPAGSPLG